MTLVTFSPEELWRPEQLNCRGEGDNIVEGGLKINFSRVKVNSSCFCIQLLSPQLPSCHILAYNSPLLPPLSLTYSLTTFVFSAKRRNILNQYCCFYCNHLEAALIISRPMIVTMSGQHKEGSMWLKPTFMRLKPTFKLRHSWSKVSSTAKQGWPLYSGIVDPCALLQIENFDV